MKLISLNIWGGRAYDQFIEFIKKQSSDADFFCFQEVLNHGKDVPGNEDGKVRMEIFSELAQLLPEFNGFLAPRDSRQESLATFVKKNINISKEDYIMVQKADSSRADGIPLHYVQFKHNDKQYTVCNLHGLWEPDTKKADIPERIEQSERVKAFLEKVDGAKIICGDFNLAPDTKSLKILEKDMRNLIKEFDITSTRSHFYTKEVKFADYALVSPEVKVLEFKVLQDAVSDHLPLLLEFE
jgi:exonuclease III